MNHIAEQLLRVRASVATAAYAAGRRPEDIKLIAVSKTHAIACVAAALAAGQRVFGENTVQEALPKIAHFAVGASPTTITPANDVVPATATPTSGVLPEWHFIGHLQSNKAKFVPGNFSWLHSLDSLKLAQRLARTAREKNAVLNVLIEVNLTGDPRKHGVAQSDVAPLIEQLLEADLTGLALRGLMTIGPYPADEAEIRRTYAALRRLRDECRARYALSGFVDLSMGMSGDYVEAIKEGSTMVRIGTAIFGERDYSE